jgi:hypothetical protein
MSELKQEKRCRKVQGKQARNRVAGKSVANLPSELTGFRVREIHLVQNFCTNQECST